jgi:Sigma-70 region 2
MGAPEMAPADEGSVGRSAAGGGDERVFEWLVQQHHTTLVRLAVRYVRDPAIAEEVAQETWLQVLKGLPRFQLRSSLKTWMTQILQRCRSRSTGACVPFFITDFYAPVAEWAGSARGAR